MESIVKAFQDKILVSKVNITQRTLKIAKAKAKYERCGLLSLIINSV